jgi:hypothetical protein
MTCGAVMLLWEIQPENDLRWQLDRIRDRVTAGQLGRDQASAQVERAYRRRDADLADLSRVLPRCPQCRAGGRPPVVHLEGCTLRP